MMTIKLNKNKKITIKWVFLNLMGSLLAFQSGFAQDTQLLGDSYYKEGMYEKAANEYKQLLKTNVTWNILSKYIRSLEKSNRQKEAVEYLKEKAVADKANQKSYQILQAGLIKHSGDTTKAKQLINQALKDAQTESQAAQLAKEINDLDEPAWAIEGWLNARNKSSNAKEYAEELAELYEQNGNYTLAMEELLKVSLEPDNKEKVLATLSKWLNTNNEPIIEKTLYAHLQQQPEQIAYNDLLIWYLIQKSRFSRALLQEKALDKRTKLEGQRVYEFGQVALKNKEYKTAADAFDYIITTYPNGRLQTLAQQAVIQVREEEIKNKFPVEGEAIRQLIADYNQMLTRTGINTQTVENVRRIANLYGTYLDKKDTALVLLDKAINLNAANQNFIDRCKLDKGDVYLLKNEPWEATLLYSQVEKSQKEEPLGHEAKLKNARLSYYKGDFEAAKGVLDVLKLATSREIANDAEQLSLLIMDNTGLDSNTNALREYAAIDLLLIQHKESQALAKIDSMMRAYADHPLQDELLWLRANLYKQQGKTADAITDLNKIVTTYGDDILGDDALFMVATLQEEVLQDKSAAMTTYEKVLTQYPGSIYVAEARKRFRKLRGDTPPN